VPTLLVATRSTGKMAEIRRILGEVPGIRVLGLDEAGMPPSVEEEDLEPYESFEENALSKAEYFSTKTGLPAVADDSGIEVEALEGAPGVRSKRFAPPAYGRGRSRDEANNRYLLERLRGVPTERRGARYVCVAALVGPAGMRIVTRGEAPGCIIDTPRGTGGFGYDPHMYDPALGKTFAEMTPREKDRRSHRGHAFRALAVELRARLDGPGSRHGGSDPGVPSP